MTRGQRATGAVGEEGLGRGPAICHLRTQSPRRGELGAGRHRTTHANHMLEPLGTLVKHPQQASIHGRTEKHNVLYPYKGVIKDSDICYSMGEPGGHHAEGNKPETMNKYYLTPLVMRSLERSNSQRQEVDGGRQGLGEGLGVSVSWGQSFSLEVDGVTAAQQCECT